jgi:sulfate permease, SulP family
LLQVLAAIIIAAMAKLLDFHHFWRALWVSPLEFVVMVITFFITFLWDIVKGLEFGILASILVLLLQLSDVDLEKLGMVKKAVGSSTMTGMVYRDQYRGVNLPDDIVVLKLTCALFFGNCAAFRNAFSEALDSGPQRIKAVILDASGMSSIDLTALTLLEEVVEDMTTRGIRLVLCNVRPSLWKTLYQANLIDSVGGCDMVGRHADDVYYRLLLDMNELPSVRAGEDARL